jgi:hypothetical protein
MNMMARKKTGVEPIERKAGRNQEREDTAIAPEEATKGNTVRLPISLWRDLKLQSIDEERPVSAIVRDAILAYLNAKGRLKAS